MAGKPPRLTLRIASLTAVVLLCAAGATLWFVNQQATAQAESQAAARAQFLTTVLLEAELTHRDFASPAQARRRHELDRLFRRAVQEEGIVRVNLITPDRLITYSTDPAAIGGLSHQSPSQVAAALRGDGVRHVSWVSIGGKRLKVLQTSLPVRPGRTSRPIGVFELYQDYNARVASHAKKTLYPVAGFLLLAILVLCAALVPILRRVTAAVEERNRRLVEQAVKLERSLASAHEARSEAEAARRAMAQQNKRLRELDRLKDEFLSLVSHELRTPLTSIRGYLELALEEDGGELSPDQRRFLQAVQRNSSRLLRLVGDLLFVAQADAGRLSLEQGKVDIAGLVAECVEAAQPAAREKEIVLSLSSSPVPALVGDRGRLAQVLDNLVSNALKFTPEGGSVSVQTSSDGEHIAVVVTDTGIGIALEDQPRLFERFFRSTAAAQQAIPGTGLGLAIVKAIVEAHSGRITVSSTEGYGTTFRVELPLAARAKPIETMDVAA
jgi:signal transduction histidine kinase